MRFAGLIHPGILGCAPSQEVLELWNKREAELIETTELKRIVAQPPQPKNVHAGKGDDAIREKVGKEGARTIPASLRCFLAGLKANWYIRGDLSMAGTVISRICPGAVKFSCQW